MRVKANSVLKTGIVIVIIAAMILTYALNLVSIPQNSSTITTPENIETETIVIQDYTSSDIVSKAEDYGDNYYKLINGEVIRIEENSVYDISGNYLGSYSED